MLTRSRFTLLFPLLACAPHAARPSAPPPAAREEVPCMSPPLRRSAPTHLLRDGQHEARVSVEQRDGCRRAFTLSTTAPLRDGQPPNPRHIEERPEAPRIRSGNDLFDALYALALEEAREDGVSSIRDGAFNEGKPVPCPAGGCYETGRLWTYVWTRDTAFSIALGLGALDPPRARNSLEFKLSERRGGGELQIVQDTGSGGSYPISTDRVSWALGAGRLLDQLDKQSRGAFASRTLEAVANTIEHDRDIAFDPRDGLYRGEQSYLDWREQSYPDWTRADVVHLGMSKALSTNVLHLQAIELAEQLARERGDRARADRWRGWADALRTRVRERFWLPDQRLFATFVPTELSPSPAARFDLLGSALAILAGVADEAQARAVLAAYPHAGKGPPVVWPQQQDVPIYHNRSSWPFATAFWLRAAREARNDAVADFSVRSLMRGAALNLSNMENFELVSGASAVDEGPLSGPVVNSQRQLWSVAGYLSMVHDVLFGLETRADGLHVRPYVTRELRRTLFANADVLVLEAFPYRGHLLEVRVALPPASGKGGGAYRVRQILLDGREAPAPIRSETLAARSRLEVVLEECDEPAATMTFLGEAPARSALFGPRLPRIASAELQRGAVSLGLDRGGEAAEAVVFHVYRDGERIGTALPGDTTRWVDPLPASKIAWAPCYSVETEYRDSGNRSQRSPPLCWAGPRGERRQTLDARTLVATGGTLVTREGRSWVDDWGAPGDRLELPRLRAKSSGEHVFSVLASNGAGPINTGVTCGVKRLVVEELPSGKTIASAPLLLPHTGGWDVWLESSFVRARLEAGREYRVRIFEDRRTINMSAFEHFALYTGGRGGRDGALNRANIAELRLLPVAPAEPSRPPPQDRTGGCAALREASASRTSPGLRRFAP